MLKVSEDTNAKLQIIENLLVKISEKGPNKKIKAMIFNSQFLLNI
jgi:hypothetical protein